MPGFDMSDYVPVNERIGAFKADWPEGSLQSTIVELTETRVTVKAYAYRTADDQRPGIGHSSVVIPGATPYTRGSEIENAETSAWGRAIAALGFEVKRGLASAEEVRNKESGQGVGPSRTTAATTADPVPAPATPAVMAAKRVGWAAQFGWSLPALEQAALNATGTPLGELDTDGWRLFAAAVVKAGPGLPVEKQAPLDQGAGEGEAESPPAVGASSAPAEPPPPKPGSPEYDGLSSDRKRAQATRYWLDVEAIEAVTA